MARRKLTDAQKQFIAGDSDNQVNQQIDTSASNQIAAEIGRNLKQELFGERKEREASIRFTVDIPESLNERLQKLSQDTKKPKTELVRTILSQALNALDY